MRFRKITFSNQWLEQMLPKAPWKFIKIRLNYLLTLSQINQKLLTIYSLKTELRLLKSNRRMTKGIKKKGSKMKNQNLFQTSKQMSRLEKIYLTNGQESTNLNSKHSRNKQYRFFNKIQSLKSPRKKNSLKIGGERKSESARLNSKILPTFLKWNVKKNTRKLFKQRKMMTMKVIGMKIQWWFHQNKGIC